MLKNLCKDPSLRAKRSNLTKRSFASLRMTSNKKKKNMKLLLIITLALHLGAFAQGPNTNINPTAQSFVENEKPCKDCDMVKQAIKAANTSSGGNHYKRSFGFKKWSKAFSGKMNLKLKKMFAHRKKLKTNYETCFNWH